MISLLAWLPLLVLAALGGQLLGGGVAVPFLMDVDLHVRFLVAMPLLIAAELVVHQRMRTVARTFRDRLLIPDGAKAGSRPPSPRRTGCATRCSPRCC